MALQKSTEYIQLDTTQPLLYCQYLYSTTINWQLSFSWSTNNDQSNPTTGSTLLPATWFTDLKQIVGNNFVDVCSKLKHTLITSFFMVYGVARLTRCPGNSVWLVKPTRLVYLCQVMKTARLQVPDGSNTTPPNSVGSPLLVELAYSVSLCYISSPDNNTHTNHNPLPTRLYYTIPYIKLLSPPQLPSPYLNLPSYNPSLLQLPTKIPLIGQLKSLSNTAIPQTLTQYKLLLSTTFLPSCW